MSVEWTQPVPGPWERKRVRMSLEIERAALRLIAERGVGQVTVDQVAAAAGISKRTFFRYFRNVPDVLTGPPRRALEHSCRLLMARPAEEHLLEAFRAVFESQQTPDSTQDNADLVADNLQTWAAIVRSDPDTAAAASGVLAVMTSGYEEVVSARLQLEESDGFTAGVLASALAGVIWFVFREHVDAAADGPVLLARLDQAFARLELLVGDPPKPSPRRGRVRALRS